MAARVLSYGDVLLREGDLALLDPPNWFNDQPGWLVCPPQLISFFFELLSREEGVAVCGLRPGGAPGPVLLVPPSLTFLLSMLGTRGQWQELDAFLAPLQVQLSRHQLLEPAPTPPRLSHHTAEPQPAPFTASQVAKRQLVLFALNNNTDSTAANGGSHWSLLVFHAATHTLRHYDSSPGTNAAVARSFARLLMPWLRHTLAGSTAEIGPALQLHEAGGPRQANAHDCGVYVCAEARFLCGAVAQQAQESLEEIEKRMQEAITPDAVINMRSELRHIIHSKIGTNC
ncbi:hypothetical protein QJQ45_020155 [Haematococcus lacustris]|nr:hypothetical protein QJQ45_020155 [Haematococcus lacustris]